MPHGGTFPSVHVEGRGKEVSVKTWRLDLVRPEHVTRAAEIWDRRGRGLATDELYFREGFGDSQNYDVRINGKAYPPKAIGSFAHHLAGEGLIPKDEFGGAKRGKWHRRFYELGFDVVYKGTKVSIFSDLSIYGDIENIVSNRQLTATQRFAEIMTRIGQGQFRNDLMKVWQGRCSVTGCMVPEAIRASHIKPWSECGSTPEERHDPQNGLLLIATLDALFDRNLISFDNDGLILISEKIPKPEYSRLGLRPDLRLRKAMGSQMLGYMKAHRERLV